MKKSMFFLLLLCLADIVWASTFTVSDFSDAGPGSLRQAITDANADGTATTGSPHIINFVLSGTISINSALPTTTNHMILNGNFSGNTVYRPGFVSYRIFYIFLGGQVVLNNIKAENGDPGGVLAGGGILNEGGNLTLNNCILDENNTGTFPGVYGGGISQLSGTLSINNSTFKNNGGGTYCRGGGINISGGTATLTNCTIQNNQTGSSANAGAIYAAGIFVLNLFNCTVIQNNSGNTSSSEATGGIFMKQG